MTHAVDGGIRYQPAWPASLHLEAGVSNLGFPLQVINAAQADPMPGRIRVGATYQFLPQLPGDTTAVLAVSTQLVRGWRQGQPLNLSLAMELAAAESVFLRAGYNFGDGLEAGATIGLGLELTRFSLGIGKAFTPVIDPEREPFHVTLALRL